MVGTMADHWMHTVIPELGMKLLRMKRYLYPSKGKMFHPRLVRGEA